MRIFYLFLTVSLLNACGSWDHYKLDASHQQTLDTWQGLEVDALYVKVGLPTKEEKLSNARTLLIYYRETDSPSSKGMPDKYFCNVNFLVGSDNRIITAKLVERVEPPWGIYMPCRKIVISAY